MSVDINVYLNKKPKNFEVWLLEQGFEKKQYDKEISYAKDGVEVALDVEDFEISGDIRKALDRNETNFPEKQPLQFVFPHPPTETMRRLNCKNSCLS